MHCRYFNIKELDCTFEGGGSRNLERFTEGGRGSFSKVKSRGTGGKAEKKRALLWGAKYRRNWWGKETAVAIPVRKERIVVREKGRE